MEKYLSAVIVFLGVACLVLFLMNNNLHEKNTQLQTALDVQSALLKETQAELELRDNVIRQRDAAVAELEQQTERKDRQYAQLLRNKKDVRDWDAVCLPDDIMGMLKAGSDSAARAARNIDARGGNP